MQDIRYRAKVLKTKKWIYRQPFHIRGTWYMYNSLWNRVRIDNRTIGQFTGQRDVNHIEIYDGDIVERHVKAFGELRVFIGAVKRYGGCWWIDTKSAAVPLWDEMHALKIIGNIYENPNLLEGGDE